MGWNKCHARVTRLLIIVSTLLFLSLSSLLATMLPSLSFFQILRVAVAPTVISVVYLFGALDSLQCPLAVARLKRGHVSQKVAWKSKQFVKRDRERDWSACSYSGLARARARPRILKNQVSVRVQSVLSHSHFSIDKRNQILFRAGCACPLLWVPVTWQSWEYADENRVTKQRKRRNSRDPISTCHSFSQTSSSTSAITCVGSRSKSIAQPYWPFCTERTYQCRKSPSLSGADTESSGKDGNRSSRIGG